MSKNSHRAVSITASTANGKNHPDDIFPLVLTKATQELFGVRNEEDITAENPFKMLEKERIIQDMRTRAAVSDFSPVKQIVLDYPQEELLLVFDSEFTYGHNYFLVLTPEAKNRILRPAVPAFVEELEGDLSKTQELRQWIPLGSEQEIDYESVQESNEKLSYRFTRMRRKFGASIFFSDSNVTDLRDGFIHCLSYQDLRFSIEQMEQDYGVQHVPQQQSVITQTPWKYLKNVSTQYEPKQLTQEEKEDILQSKGLKTFCKFLSPRILLALQQNEIIEEISDDSRVLDPHSEPIDWSEKDADGLILCQAFSYLKYTKHKKVSCIQWHPTIEGVLAASLVEKLQGEESKNESATKSSLSPPCILFFRFSHPSNPRLLLECPDDIFAFEFCPSDPNIIVGGCRNGQVVLWDISSSVTHLQLPGATQLIPCNIGTYDLNGKKESEVRTVHFCAVSMLQNSHKAPITDVQWLPPTFEVTRMGRPVETKDNLCVQVISCSPDCSIMFWDIRIPKVLSQLVSVLKQNEEEKPTKKSIPNPFKHLDQTWKPLFKVSLPKIATSGEYASLKFNLEPYMWDVRSAQNTNLRSEVIPDYSQLRVPSAKTMRSLEDVDTRLYIGTEDGEIVCADWKLQADDSGRVNSAKPLHHFSIHHRLVNTIQRSPFFKDILLTVGGWNFAIWREGVMDGPIIQPPGSEQQCTTGCWSLSRPAVFFIGKENGKIEVWNLLEKTNGPSQVLTHATSAKITCLKPWILSPKAHFLAVSDNLGIVHIFEIPNKLQSPSKNEQENLRKYLGGEVDRLRDFVRMEEMWLKREEEDLRKQLANNALEESEKEDAKEYGDYLVLEEAALKAMGVLLNRDIC